MVLALATSASSTRYSATVSGVAGRATSPRWSAQALKLGPVGAIGAHGCLGLGGVDVAPGLFGQLLEAGQDYRASTRTSCIWWRTPDVWPRPSIGCSRQPTN